MKHDALIIGATRGTGKQITNLLLSKGHKPLVVARDLNKARSIFLEEVEILYGDVTQPQTLEQALVKGISPIIYTVDITGGIGGRGILGSKQEIRNVVYNGVANTIDIAQQCKWQGQFILLTTLGLNQSSLIMKILDILKPGVLQASRDKATCLINSGFTYTIVQAGSLHDGIDSGQPLAISQGDIKMTLDTKLSRLHLAQVMISCIGNPSTYNKIFNVYGGQGDKLDEGSILAQLSAVLQK